MPRSEIVELVERLVAMPTERPLRVAVDGITAAGKSTFAAGLAGEITAAGRPGVHLSTDDYHHQRARRHRNSDPAVGYYDDAYDLDAFRELVLVPLGPGGSRRYQARHHDLETDEILPAQTDSASPDAIVVVDGSFLQRPELAGHWDLVIWVDTSFPVALARAMDRDEKLFGGRDETRVAYETRYHAACRRYLDQVRPIEAAHVVVPND